MPTLTFRPPPPPSSRRPRAGRAAFTLVELLVVLGMILVLIALLLPAISGARTRALRTRMAADMQAIAAALEAYRQDHGDIPRVSPDGARPNYGAPPALTENYAGAQILCRALLGPGSAAADGADGLGFRKIPLAVTQTKVSGPYLEPSKFRTANFDGTTTNIVANTSVLIDSEDKPILYYPGLPKADVTANNGYAVPGTYLPGGRAMFDTNDNLGNASSMMSASKLQLLLGDQNKNGKIDPGEAPAYKGAFLVISAGPDRRYGPRNANAPISASNPCDDVANFDRPPTQ